MVEEKRSGDNIFKVMADKNDSSTCFVWIFRESNEFCSSQCERKCEIVRGSNSFNSLRKADLKNIQ